MAYDDYTELDEVEAGSRKGALCREYEANGKDAMLKLNALFATPIKDSTMATWRSYLDQRK